MRFYLIIIVEGVGDGGGGLEGAAYGAFGGDFEEAEALVFGEGGGLQGDGAGEGVVFLALWRGGFGVVHGGANVRKGPALAGGIHAQGLVGAGA